MRSFGRLLWILWGSVSTVTLVAMALLIGPIGEPSLGEPIDLDTIPAAPETPTQSPTPEPTTSPTETATTPAPATQSPRSTPKSSVIPPKPAAPKHVPVPVCDDDDCEEWDDDEWDDEWDDDEWDDD